MKKDYSSNYLKNLIFQILGTVVGLLSLFIVVPSLSTNQSLYGIYSVCISLNIFFNYSDLGFLSAGQKFSGEYYAQNNIIAEERIISFIAFVMICMSFIFCFCLIPLVFNPRLLVSEISGYNSHVASVIILIIIISAPFIALRRVFQICYTCRLEQYKYQIITLLGHTIKILSVFYFFRNNNYHILVYFLFVNIIDIVISVVIFGYAIYLYNYSIRRLAFAFRFDAGLWKTTKEIAGASLLSTISWVLYYELDLIVLAKISTPYYLSLYSTAFTLLSFSRSYFSILYSSFAARFNHYVGTGNSNGLKNLYINSIQIVFPLAFFPIITFMVIGEPLIISWVGQNYRESAGIAVLLYSGSLLAFLSYPSGLYLFAVGDTKQLNILSTMLPLIFWIGVVLLNPILGIGAFAVSKSISQLTNAIYSFCRIIKKLKISIHDLFKDLLSQSLLPLFFLGAIGPLCHHFMEYEKGTSALFTNVCLFGILLSIIIAISLVRSGNLKTFVSIVFKKDLKIRV